MNTQESDFEVEATDLNTGANIRHPLDEKAATASQRDDGSRLSWMSLRSRRMRTMLVTSGVLLAVALVTLVDPALRSSLSTALLPPPTPSTAWPANADLVLLESGAPWGAYSLDGLTTSPLVQPDSQLSSVWIRLTPGRHTLHVTQPPFPSLKCTISLPTTRSDTCPLVSPLALRGPYFGNQPGPPPNSRVIDLGARFDRLPESAQAALVAAVRALLSLPVTPVTIQPGDHYLRDDGSVAVASAPLQITLQPLLIPPNWSVPSDSATCQSFCDALTDYGRSSTPGSMWSLAVAQSATWRVATGNGQVITSHALLWPSAQPYTSLSPDALALHTAFDVRWNGSWQILSQSDFSFGDLSPSLRQVAIEMTGALLSASPGVATNNMNIYEGRGLTANQGWVVSLTLSDPSATTPLYLYYHFGTLLAANEAAHRAFPAIPVASANEQTLARAIMGIPG